MHENTKQCNIYIDEAGDLGFNRGTRWFILSAVVVNSENENDIRKAIKAIKTKLNINAIHFRNLRNFEQRCYVVSELSKCSFKIVNVIIDTTKINLNKIKYNGNSNTTNPSLYLYNYACRYLIERISWILRDSGRQGKIILSSRGTSKDKDLSEYISTKLLSYGSNAICKQITSVCSKSASEWDMLQLADVCATSMFYCHEPNHFGFVSPCYVRPLKKHLYAHNNAITKYGVKYFSDEMAPDKDYFKRKTICEQ